MTVLKPVMHDVGGHGPQKIIILRHVVKYQLDCKDMLLDRAQDNGVGAKGRV